MEYIRKKNIEEESIVIEEIATALTYKGHLSCPKCNYNYCGTINQNNTTCIFCPICHVRTGFFRIQDSIGLLEKAWRIGKVIEMSERERRIFN